MDKTVADYLRQVASDEHAPLAFDICTADEARADGAMTTGDLPDGQKPSTDDAKGSSRKERPRVSLS